MPEHPVPRAHPVIAEPVVPADAVDHEPAEPRRLPLIEWALPALAAVLLAAAAWCLVRVLTPLELYGSMDAAEQFLIQIQMTLPGPLLVASTITSTAWLVLRALRPGEPMKLRYAVILGVAALVLAVGAVVSASEATNLLVLVNDAYDSQTVTEEDFAELGRLQLRSSMLVQFVAPAILAATIPATGALVLLVVRSRRHRVASASATAS